MAWKLCCGILDWWNNSIHIIKCEIKGENMNKTKCPKCGYEFEQGAVNKCPRCSAIINNCKGCTGNCLKCSTKKE
ncbi:MAG: hypothetical protein K0Q99_848 [Clostridia bacterium]|jgi:predicted Zn-ribbon and HTH transcriptional regulator|nr:hypothetical protein [Clostridia bacterium]